MNANDASAPKWFSVVSILALLWNLFGMMTYFMQVRMSPETLAAMPEAQRALYESYPSWAIAAYAIAVHAGALGSLLLVLKRNWAGPVLLVSLVAVLAQMAHSIFVARTYEVMGTGALVMPLVIIAVAIYLVILAGQAKAKGWTR